MSKVNISAIVAVDSKGGIGKDNGIPWKCKEDMEYFRKFTTGTTCVMGRKTFESIEKYNKNTTRRDLLPLRNLIVLTSRKPPAAERNTFENLIFVSDLAELKKNILAGYYGYRVCIIGGASLYEEFAPYYTEVSITEIEKDYDCDTFVDVNKLKFRKELTIREPTKITTKDYAKGIIRVYGEKPERRDTPYDYTLYR